MGRTRQNFGPLFEAERAVPDVVTDTAESEHQNAEDADATCRALDRYGPGAVVAVHVVEKGGGVPDKASVEQREEMAAEAFEVVRERFPESPMYLTATAERLFVSGQGWVQALDTDGETDWGLTFENDGEDVPVGPLAVGEETVYAWRPAPSEATADESSEPTARLCALDTADGSVRWTADGVAVETGPFLPAAAERLVAVPTADGALAGLDAADGSRRWRFDPGEGPCSPAAIVDDAVYVVGGARLYALEAR